ncbi:MAG: hypothetical protein JWL82_318 [Parcubacteria group bacterium]|nr:hypothetical protein [Parcubacteria group bacterium]
MPTSSAYATPVGLHFATVSMSEVIPVIFFLVFFVWAIYTVVASFHWLRYAGNTTVALSAITVHVIVSLALASYAVSGF